MYKRPFTAICQKSGRTKAISIDVPDGKDKALEAAKEQLPDENIIALIPGQHARNVYTYNAEGMATKKPAAELADVWPTNLPPGF
jgi:hypothetical protein